MDTHKLTGAERDFFRVITNIICTNPFSADYRKTSALLTPYTALSQEEPANHAHVFYMLKTPLGQHLGRLRARGVSNLQALKGEDRRLLENAFLFEVYLSHLVELDRHIQDQLAHNASPIKVSFADSLVADLMERGFSSDESYRCLALLYQFRRAFFFIGTALIGNCPSMRELRCSLWNNVFTFNVRNFSVYLWDRMEDFSTLIIGETGTGKNAAAEAIGRSGLMLFDKSSGVFSHTLGQAYLPINLSEHPESLIESELFGHRKGAFTGAVDNFDGVFSRCLANGTLFLDEIGEVSESIQVKLLNVLQNRQFTAVGSNKSCRFTGRVIAATNKSISQLRKRGKMRDDLFYRLSSDIIVMPTLRERVRENPDELLQLIKLLISRITGFEDAELAAWVASRLTTKLPKDYTWPGNVRELEQAVRRVLLKQQYEGYSYDSRQQSLRGNILELPSAEVDAKQLIALYCHLLYQQHGTYETVARIVKLDRRTVKKYIMSFEF